jgi:hypothetical protein
LRRGRPGRKQLAERGQPTISAPVCGGGSVRARQWVLASSWQGTETGTQQLRTALRDCRKLWHQVQQLGEKTGA